MEVAVAFVFLLLSAPGGGMLSMSQDSRHLSSHKGIVNY